jgi:hypothetical protein
MDSGTIGPLLSNLTSLRDLRKSEKTVGSSNASIRSTMLSRIAVQENTDEHEDLTWRPFPTTRGVDLGRS